MNEQDKQCSKPICVVIDTNVWIQMPLLKNSTGAALIYSLSKGKLKLGLPEIIEREILKNIISKMRENIDKVKDGLRQIQMIMGKSPIVNYPSDETIEDAVINRIQEFERLSILKRIPIKLEHTKAAIDRLIKDLPPNAPKNQQFKDSLIWESLKELAKKFKIYFISNDNGFYLPDKNNNKMAKVLEEECTQEQIEINLFRNIEDCLSHLEASIPQSKSETEELVKVISEAIKPDLLKDTIKKDLDIGNMINNKINPFLTEKTNVIAISYEITFEGIETVSDPNLLRSDISFTANGDCSYSLQNKNIFDNYLHEVNYCWTENGSDIQRRNSRYIHLASATNSRMEPYKFRAPIRK